jgi:hypothetical protein
LVRGLNFISAVSGIFKIRRARFALANELSFALPDEEQSAFDFPARAVASFAKEEIASNGVPDFSKMTQAEKLAYHKSRWDRILG